MSWKPPARLTRLLWLATLVLWIAVALFPVSNRLSRGSGVVLLMAVWVGLIGLCWQRRALRFCLLGITLIVGLFFMLPARTPPSADALRSDYVACLRRYEGVPYYWGGESPRGIDCSGLVRRGLIDALFLRGLRGLDPGLLRHSLTLWWHDCSAKDLRDGTNRLTSPLFDAANILQLDHSTLLPGDLAVTKDGSHILAYLGNQQWIEADPVDERVIILPVAEGSNSWLKTRMKILRWRLLE
jgi:hypothetical protein